MKTILLLFILLFPATTAVAGNMEALYIRAYWDNSLNRDTPFNYVISNSTLCVMKEAETKDSWNVPSGTDTVYAMFIIVRFSHEYSGKCIDVANVADQYFSDNNSNLLKGIIAIHTCNDDIYGRSGACKHTIIRSKNWP